MAVKSSISFGLVNIPVVLNPIIKNNDTSFNQLHKKCKSRISYVKFCKHCDEELKEDEIIKGYQYEKDKYIEFTKKEIDILKPENEGEIEIVSFVKITDIDPAYFEKSYLLGTEKKSRAYSLFVEALKQTKMVALAKTVISTKFYYCILRFSENRIIMTTLYFFEEINLKNVEVETKLNPKELDLAIKLVKSLEAKFEPEKYNDEYQDRIREAIDTKLNGDKIKRKKSSSKKEITDLMKALETSLKKKK